jgi:hypothetical protein
VYSRLESFCWRRDEANAATVVYLRTDWWPGCHPYDEMTGTLADGSWLTPDITYTPTSVTITMRINDAYYRRSCPVRWLHLPACGAAVSVSAFGAS